MLIWIQRLSFIGTTKIIFSLLYYVSEITKQASPATYEIQKEGSLYFIAPVPKQIYIDYDPVKDVLNLSSLGDYLRN